MKKQSYTKAAKAAIEKILTESINDPSATSARQMLSSNRDGTDKKFTKAQFIKAPGFSAINVRTWNKDKNTPKFTKEEYAKHFKQVRFLRDWNVAGLTPKFTDAEIEKAGK